METIGPLSAGVTHEFRNALSIILREADSARNEVMSGSDVSRSLNVIQSAARRASNVTDNLLAFSRKKPRHPEPVEVRQFLQDLAQIVSSLGRDANSFSGGR